MKNESVCSILTASYLRSGLSKRGTRLAVDLIRAIVFTIIKEVAAQSRADASAIGTHELVLLTRGSHFIVRCRHKPTFTLIQVQEEPRNHQSVFEEHNSRHWLSSDLSPQLSTPSHLFDSCRHTRSFWQRNTLVGGHWNLPDEEGAESGGKKGKKTAQGKKATSDRYLTCVNI